MSDVIGIFMTLEGFILSLTVFALAIFLGFELISKVPPTLHTPLMSGANAISGISIVGALLAANNGEANTATILAFFAIVLATINVVGGFLVTDRMLKMFKKGVVINGRSIIFTRYWLSNLSHIIHLWNKDVGFTQNCT